MYLFIIIKSVKTCPFLKSVTSNRPSDGRTGFEVSFLLNLDVCFWLGFTTGLSLAFPLDVDAVSFTRGISSTLRGSALKIDNPFLSLFCFVFDPFLRLFC